ncbi:carbohydrate ABC transporter permease [Gracilibacillus phocaeensis]|uniref:carbohydrate ABC transporter permease n=1 Tax=Gracilibacillus phocaeensis TaxID=2042304 RepID=UPI001030673D|nr:sugar ABC transporter permease [Gracilibacillus phocaeensis]
MRKNNLRNLIQGEQWSGYGFTFPSLVVLLLLVTYPLLYGTYISFFDTNLVNKWDFIGIENYTRIFSNMEFIRSIGLTLLYSILVIAGHFIVGIAFGLILNMKLRGILLFRALLIVPWLLPEVVVALLWKWLFNPVYGLFNHYLMLFNITSEPISWLGQETAAFTAIVLVSIWKGYPLIMMMVLAGLQSISQEQYEAAKIDGANLFQSFRYITIPGLMPVLLVSLILDTVWWFKHFTMIWILTQGGPGAATNIISIDIFKQAFEFFNFGRASAMAVIVFFICLFIGLTYRRILGDDDN